MFIVILLCFLFNLFNLFNLPEAAGQDRGASPFNPAPAGQDRYQDRHEYESYTKLQLRGMHQKKNSRNNA